MHRFLDRLGSIASPLAFVIAIAASLLEMPWIAWIPHQPTRQAYGWINCCGCAGTTCR